MKTAAELYEELTPQSDENGNTEVNTEGSAI